MSREGDAPIMAKLADSEIINPLNKQTKLTLPMGIIFYPKTACYV
jgi:hypothetical protein